MVVDKTPQNRALNIVIKAVIALLASKNTWQNMGPRHVPKPIGGTPGTSDGFEPTHFHKWFNELEIQEPLIKLIGG